MIRPGVPPRGEHLNRDRPDDRPDDHPDQESRPHPAEDARQPTAAERVRTLLEANTSASLTIPAAEPATPGHTVQEACAVAPSGDVFLLVPAVSQAARATAYAQDDEVTAVMEITDVAPVAMPHRIRGRAWVAGWLTPVTGTARAAAARLLAERGVAPDLLEPAPEWTLLRLEVGEAYIDDLWGASPVEPDDFTEARPDPLARHESELLQHMASAHEAQLWSLCALLGNGDLGCPDWRRVVPLGLDRFGLRVRFCAERTCFDARFEFPEPIRDISRLRHALRHLFDAAAS